MGIGFRGSEASGHRDASQSNTPVVSFSICKLNLHNYLQLQLHQGFIVNCAANAKSVKNYSVFGSFCFSARLLSKDKRKLRVLSSVSSKIMRSS